MLSIQQIKQILGDEANAISDEEVANLAVMIKSICSIIVESYIKEKHEVNTIR